MEIRPRRFGGEGVLIGVSNGHTKMLKPHLSISSRSSGLGGAKNDVAPSPELGGGCVIFGRFLGIGP